MNSATNLLRKPGRVGQAMLAAALCTVSANAHAFTYVFSGGIYAPGTTSPNPLLAPDTLALTTVSDKAFNSAFINQSGTVDWQGRSLAALCSERFDRRPTPQGGAQASIAFASFATVLHSGNPKRYLDRTDARMDDLPQLLRVVSCQPAQDAQALFLRYLLALLTGNGDAHLDNWGMLGAWPQARLSPVYDPAPMRAFGYNCLSALGLGSGNVDWTLGYVPPDLAKRLADFAKQLGLRSDTAAKLRLTALAATQDYASGTREAWSARNPEPLAVFLHRIEQVRLALV